MRYFKHKINEGFENAFDSSLVDYSNDFEKNDNDFLYKPANDIVKKYWSSFIDSFSKEKNILSDIILNDWGKYKYQAVLKIAQLRNNLRYGYFNYTHNYLMKNNHSGYIVFNIEIIRYTGRRPYAGNMMIELYLNGEKVYEYPKIIKFTINTSDNFNSKYKINKIDKIFDIINTDIKDLYLNSNLYNFYIDFLLSKHGTAYPVEHKDWERMDKCRKTRDYKASKLIKDKRKAVARFVAGWILEHPGENMRTSFSFYQEYVNNYENNLNSFMATALYLGAKVGDILSTYDEAIKNKPNNI